MVTKPAILGSPGGLRLVLRWRDDYGTDGPVGMTWGDLQLWVNDTLVWGALDATGHSEGIRWSWIELLEFLGNAWPYLVEEERYPIEFEQQTDTPRHLGELSGKARLRWHKLSEAQAESEDGLLRDFLSVHDFAEALQGAYPPSLLLMRQGNQMLAATNRNAWELPFASTLATLEELAEMIAERVADLGDSRSEQARKRWSERNAIDPARRLSIATGQNAGRLRAIWPLDIDLEAANDGRYDLKAAARMIGGLAVDQAKTVLAKIQALPAGGPLALGPLSEEAADLMREHVSELPAIQGYLLAALLREHLKNDNDRIDPGVILNGWGVVVHEMQLADTGIDAVAVWGNGHRATVLINTLGPRAQVPTGTRSTLAHEICHLLIDREGALPAVEVLGGKVPRHIEQRANAFAAELLLPRSVAGTYLKQALDYVTLPDARDQEIESAISGLAERYGASHEITAWQILNSGIADPEDQPVLERKLNSIHRPY